VACGTGRFATFFKDNWPSADLTLADLSPFYLAEARQNLRYWKSQRAAGAALPGVDRNGAAFLQAAAEALPAPDASYDLVYSVYLFHELPPAARRAAAGEMARVVKPGGMVVLTDSMQLGDRPIFDATMANFGDFNEPFYRGYVAEDLGALFVEAGLECDTKVVGSTTKTLSFRKPLAAAGAAAEVAEALEGLPAPPQAGDHNQN
jgi:ubiquinone/menaquinone biosynthesis C-methylase UbiE